MMENALGDLYAGVGTIHVSPLVATLLIADNLLVEVNGLYYTKLGTKVVVGTGYLSTAMYGTGDVTVFRSTKVNVESPGLDSNTVNVLVERAYVVVADCVSLRIAAPAPQSQSGETPTPQVPVTVVTGTDELEGPGDSWTPPTGDLKGVTVVVTNGTLVVDGTNVTAPDSVSFDADELEVLLPPTITADDDDDRGVVSWVVIP